MAQTARSLEADKRLCEAATPEPWVFQRAPAGFVHIRWLVRTPASEAGKELFNAGLIVDNEADARFVAEARQALPYWLSEVERLRNARSVTIDRFEKRLAEMEARLAWKIFSFWVGQVVVMIAVLEVFFRFFR